MNYKQHSFKAMGGPVDVKLYGHSDSMLVQSCQLIEKEIRRLETKYSRYRNDSVTAAINNAAKEAKSINVDDETASLLNYAHVAYQQSGGLFDITSGVLREVWDFKSLKSPPEAFLVAKLLELVGWTHIMWEAPKLTFLRKNMQLDFGGYVKEYAADCAANICRRQGIVSGIVNLAGDISVLGPKPNGSPWEIGIRHPRSPETAYAKIEIGSGAIATSGDYERFFIYDDTRYCHILNPKTGFPVQGLASVTVCAESCLVAGTASTITMLKEDRGAEWIENLGLPYLLLDQAIKPSGSITTI